MKKPKKKRHEAINFIIILLVAAVVTFVALFIIAYCKGLTKNVFTKQTEEEVVFPEDIDEIVPETTVPTEDTSVYDKCQEIVSVCSTITNMANNEELEVTMSDDGAFIYQNAEYKLVSVPEGPDYTRQVYYYQNGVLIAASYFTAEGSTEFFFNEGSLIIWRQMDAQGAELEAHTDREDPQFTTWEQEITSAAAAF